MLASSPKPSTSSRPARSPDENTHFSNGRAYLGLARGAWLGAVGITQERPVRRLCEAVEVVRHLFAGNDDAYRGEIFQMEQGTCLAYRPLRREVDLMLGTWGPLGMSLAGEIASEVKIGGTANPALLAPAKKSLVHGEVRAHRPPGETGLVCGAVTVVDDDSTRARRLARAEVAMYLPVVASLDPAPGLEEVDLAAIQSLARAGQHDEAARLVPDSVLDRFAFSGTPDQVATQVTALSRPVPRASSSGLPTALRQRTASNSSAGAFCPRSLPKRRHLAGQP